MRKVPDPQRQWLIRSRKSCGKTPESISEPYSNFGFRFDTTLRARIASPFSVITPTARPASTKTSRTGLATRISTPRAVAALAIAWVMAPIPPIGVPPGAFLAVNLAKYMVQEHVGGACRVGTRVVADHAVETIGGFDRRALEPRVEIISRRFDEQIQQFAPHRQVQLRDPFGLARAAQQFGQRLQPSAGGDIRRRLQHQIAQDVGNHVETLAVSAQALGIARGELRNFAGGMCPRPL